MLIKLLLFLIPVIVFSNEVIWDSKQEAVLSQAEYDEVIRLYVDKKYPEKAEAYKVAQTVSLNGLIWQDNRETKTLTMNWVDAKNYCTHLSLVGFNDWRLPSKKELESIVEKSRKPTIKKEFKFVKDKWYWSITKDKKNSSMACDVSFRYGGDGYSFKSVRNYVRCVRGRQ